MDIITYVLCKKAISSIEEELSLKEDTSEKKVSDFFIAHPEFNNIALKDLDTQRKEKYNDYLLAVKSLYDNAQDDKEYLFPYSNDELCYLTTVNLEDSDKLISFVRLLNAKNYKLIEEEEILKIVETSEDIASLQAQVDELENWATNLKVEGGEM